MENETVRLQKFLSERGVASRRHAAVLVEEGRVAVNGTVVKIPGARVSPTGDTVTVDGQPVEARPPKPLTIALHKPRGYICSASSSDGQTVYDLIRGVPARVVPVGRLDKNSEGLLLMSNDGEFVDRLTHPRYLQEKAYRVTVSGDVTPAVLNTLRSELVIDGHRIQPVEVRYIRKGEAAGRSVLEFILREGRKRQIRQMCQQAGLTVCRLVRTRIRGLGLGSLKPGQWRELSQDEVQGLLRGTDEE